MVFVKNIFNIIFISEKNDLETPFFVFVNKK